MRGIVPRLGPVVLAVACSGASALPPEAPPEPPHAPLAPILFEAQTVNQHPVETRRQNIVDVVHGKRIADPYRWLESSSDPEVKAWVSEQNRVTEARLSSVPAHDAIQQRLEKLLGIGQISLPSVRRRGRASFRYFYTRREGSQNQPVLLVRDSLNGDDRVLLDPNQLSPDGTVALDWYYPSNEGELLAYGVSEDGSEESTLKIRNVKTGEDLPDVIPRARYASVCWLPGGKRFFYSRFPQPGSVPAGEEKYHRKIFEHELGRAPADDPLVFGADLPMTDFPACTISPNGRWLVVRVHQGWSKSEVYLADTRQRPLAWQRLTQGDSHVYNPIALDDAIYIHTNEDAARYRLLAVDPEHPGRKRWKQVIAEHPEDVLEGFDVVGGQVFASYLVGPVSRLERFTKQGKSLGAIELPTLGSSDDFSGVHDGDEVFFDFESFAHPQSIHRLELRSGKQSIWQQVSSPIDPDDFVVTPRKAQSSDGTSVPYLIVRGKDVDPTSGKNPTLLYGYGGFNVNLQPRFSRTNYVFLERGGVYVQANLRGGGEFGEDWHRAGQRENKQNVFDDFTAVARDLIHTKLTNPKRLAIYGRSNGGLLVAAAITQHPELFRAAVSSVPLTDMLRYQKFLIAKLWVPEYGDPRDPEAFQWLARYSPYHQVKKGTSYPAVLLMTAASDTRVDPMHARKMAAALQYATSSGRPVLLRTETQAGHGAGKPIAKVAEEYADLYSFVLWQLGVVAGPN